MFRGKSFPLLWHCYYYPHALTSVICSRLLTEGWEGLGRVRVREGKGLYFSCSVSASVAGSVTVRFNPLRLLYDFVLHKHISFYMIWTKFRLG